MGNVASKAEVDLFYYFYSGKECRWLSGPKAWVAGLRG